MSHQGLHLKPLNWEVTGAVPVRPVVSVEAPSFSYFSKSRNNELTRRRSQMRRRAQKHWRGHQCCALGPEAPPSPGS